jgi:hypothetical protein
MSETESAAVGDRIVVTPNDQMHRIMRHEFSNGTEFDPAPLHAYLNTLTEQQVRLLLSYPRQKYLGRQRLVVFVTLDPANTNLPMCADECDSAATLINSNSHFAVFRCDGAAQFVSLVCYTREFNLFRGRPKLDPRDSANPTVYKVSAMNMSHVPSGEGDTIWNRVSRVGSGDRGTAISGGDDTHAPNSLHGMINTQGCWMLFRNYNWYQPEQAAFTQVYRDFRRSRAGMTDALRARLTSLGYAESDPALINQRFLALERNYAYTWFTRDIIGIDYFSTNPFVNDTNVDGANKLTLFPSPPPATGFNSHSWGSRHKTERSFQMTRSLWTENALGFRTAEDFAHFAGRVTTKLESRSWADLYVFG